MNQPQTNTTDLLPIALLDAIRPSAASATQPVLQYDALEPIALQQQPLRRERQQLFDAAQKDSWDWIKYKTELQKQDIIDSAFALQQATSKAEQQLWSQRFTEASAALYGLPDSQTAASLLKQEITWLNDLAHNPHVDQKLRAEVMAFYVHHGGQHLHSADANFTLDSTITAGVNHYILNNFGDAINAVAPDASQATLSPQDIAAAFTKGLAVLCDQNPAWSDWYVIAKDGGSLAVHCDRHQIIVGLQREALPASQIQGKFAHEVLTHALRQVNAHATGDPIIQKGFNGYTNAEEGLACIMEYAITGTTDRRPMERYLDIALALGLFTGIPVPRAQLHRMVLARTLVAEQAKSNNPTTELVAPGAWEHVNRIYRGTRGDAIVGIFTKDIVYYEGLRTMAAFLRAESKNQTIPQILNYLLTCKFNPFNEAQAAYIQNYLQQPRLPKS